MDSTLPELSREQVLDLATQGFFFVEEACELYMEKGGASCDLISWYLTNEQDLIWQDD